LLVAGGCESASNFDPATLRLQVDRPNTTVYQLNQRQTRPTALILEYTEELWPEPKAAADRPLISPAGSRRPVSGRLSRLILPVEPAKLLHALAGIYLGGKDIALSIDGNIVERRELADLPPGPTETV
jgi:hypothetical protein